MRTHHAALILLTTLGCGESRSAPPPTLRHVQTELRREFNTRYLHVWSASPETLQIAVRGGRVVRGVSGNLSVTESQHELLARRALELLAPNPVDRPRELEVVVVETEASRRLGPLVFGRHRQSSAFRVATLGASLADSAASDSVLRGTLRTLVPGDTAP